MTHIQTLELENERKNRTISGFSTAGFFTLLALLLWLVHFDKPTKEELPEEYEIPVSIGEEPGGGGSGAPADNAPVEAAPDVPRMSLPAATEQTNDQNAVAQKRTSTTPTPTQKVDPDASEEAAINKMLSTKKGTTSGSGGTGSNDPFGKGNGTGVGDGDGPGTGDGPGGNGSGYNVTGLGSRKLLGYVKAPDRCNTAGTVKLDIVVNPDGKIISAVGVTGYDDNVCLVNRAKECIRNAHFEQTNSTKMVTGQITITFSYK